MAAEPDDAAGLAEQCARLPLALRVAAELAITRPATPLAVLVVELADEQRRLELLKAGGDPRTAVRAVFSWSYQHLPAEAARAFRLLGLHLGPDLDPYAAAALTHTSLDQAQHLLEVLGRAHLIESTSPGRYSMHNLLRIYATDRAAIEDSEQEPRAALIRLFDHYLATAAAATDTLHPAEKHRWPRIGPPATPSPLVAEPDAAQAWLDTERATLTATCAHTAAHGWPRHTIGLASTLFHYLEVGGHYPDAVAIHTHALHAARAVDDSCGEADALTNLGGIYWRQGHYGQAAHHHQQALTLSREIDHWDGEAYALTNLGLVYSRQGRYQQAAEHHQQTLVMFREIGYRGGEAEALNGVGEAHYGTGQLREAGIQHTTALALPARSASDTSRPAPTTDLPTSTMPPASSARLGTTGATPSPSIPTSASPTPRTSRPTWPALDSDNGD